MVYRVHATINFTALKNVATGTKLMKQIMYTVQNIGTTQEI